MCCIKRLCIFGPKGAIQICYYYYYYYYYYYFFIIIIIIIYSDIARVISLRIIIINIIMDIIIGGGS